jgi:hypothetical protein
MVVKVDSVRVFEIFDNSFSKGIISLGADGLVKIDYFKLEK